MTKIKLQPSELEDGTTPDPIYVNEDFTLESTELIGNFSLVGFSKYKTQVNKGILDVDYQTFWANPEFCINAYLVYVDNDSLEGDLYVYVSKINSYEVITEP